MWKRKLIRGTNALERKEILFKGSGAALIQFHCSTAVQDMRSYFDVYHQLLHGRLGLAELLTWQVNEEETLRYIGGKMQY